jgi:hypothetical protein
MMNSPTPETAVTQMLPNCNQRTKAMNGLYKLTPDVAAALADSSTVVFLVLHSGHDIRLDVLMGAERSIPDLQYRREYTLREMAGAEWWDTLPKWHRIIAGETFAFLVAQGVFPLEFACHPERSNKVYRRV